MPGPGDHVRISGHAGLGSFVTQQGDCAIVDLRTVESTGEVSTVKRKPGFRMIDPRRLRVLQAVAASGSVAAAAQTLHLTPPAVSQQLMALERETRTTLVDRSGRQVALTAAGRLLAEHAEKITTQLRQAERDLAELTGRVAGPVRLAAFQSVMSPLIAPALRTLARTHPAILPTIAERYGPAAVADLRRGDLDIVLTEYDAGCGPPDEPGLGLRRLAFDPYLLIVPQDWAITVHSPDDLDGRPWVAGPPGTACDHALRRLAAQGGIAIAASDVCVEFPSVIALVAAGRGAAIIPRLALADAPVATYSLPELGGRHIAALHRTGTGYPAPATATVLSTLAETGQQHENYGQK
jgi:DNA-binding transcriptional LysR family regulator